MSKQDITITITTIVADYDHAGQVLSLAQTVDNYNLSHERSNHRSTTTKKMKKNEQKRNKRRRSWEIDGRRGAHRDGSSFYFLCPSSTIHCRPAGVTNESTSQRNIEQKQRERGRESTKQYRYWVRAARPKCSFPARSLTQVQHRIQDKIKRRKKKSTTSTTKEWLVKVRWISRLIFFSYLPW